MELGIEYLGSEPPGLSLQLLLTSYCTSNKTLVLRLPEICGLPCGNADLGPPSHKATHKFPRWQSTGARKTALLGSRGRAVGSRASCPSPASGHFLIPGYPRICDNRSYLLRRSVEKEY